jgi:hypothetical protein
MSVLPPAAACGGPCPSMRRTRSRMLLRTPEACATGLDGAEADAVVGDAVAQDELEDLQRRAVTVAATTLSSRAAPHANVWAQRLTGPIGTVELVAQPARVARAALAESTVTRRPKTTHRPKTDYAPPSRNPTFLVGRAIRDAYMPNAAMAARLVR